MEIRLDKEAALVETVLFLESEPQDEAALSRATGLAQDIVERALELLREEYEAPHHGLEPVRAGGGWILAPKAELWGVLKERYGKKNESRLSRAALETLSIIAYSQPITRAEVEAIRGVSADGMVRFLLDKQFIKEVGKKDVPGKPVQYGTTKEFLKYFRLGSIADLPKLDALERGRFEDEEEAEPGERAAAAAQVLEGLEPLPESAPAVQPKADSPAGADSAEPPSPAFEAPAPPAAAPLPWEAPDA